MALPGTMAGTIGRFDASDVTLESFAGGEGIRILDVDGEQTELTTASTTITGRASTVIEDTRPSVTVHDTNVNIDREKYRNRIGTEWAARGRTVFAESCVEEGGGTFPFTLLSSVANVKCERLYFDTDNLQKAWREDGTLTDTWLAGSKENGDSTVMAYGDASRDEHSDIGLGFERSWDGWMLRGVVYHSGFVSVYEDLGAGTFLRFATEELLPHAYVPDDDEDDGTTQVSLGGE